MTIEWRKAIGRRSILLFELEDALGKSIYYIKALVKVHYYYFFLRKILLLTVDLGSLQKDWFLGITNDSHANTHDMVPNPLAYPIHAKRQPQYAAAMQQAIAL